MSRQPPHEQLGERVMGAQAGVVRLSLPKGGMARRPGSAPSAQQAGDDVLSPAPLCGVEPVLLRDGLPRDLEEDRQVLLRAQVLGAATVLGASLV